MRDSSLLRKTTLLARDNLALHDRQIMSAEIAGKIILLDEIRFRETLFIYVDFRSEVATHLLITELLRLGKRVVVPVTLVKEKRLLLVAIRNVEEDLVPGYCSIPEPRMELRKSNLVAGSEVETIILPGSVFDERGGRLGYGGGYYDRFMAYEAPQARRIGLAFELQMVEKLSLQDHDEMLDLIVTEKRIIQGIR
ncbi:MAG: 5-formyltetrahydrofolate cyclo-ligase [Proteobacteria bacterium]|nr:5-formyltetrahydrofolate cyclo-ligase [Pseudomonadota bacterium]MBU1650181.1 5-formyltetrahydrofolate cyclo-ligase [Pseudomonadota bacterium]